MYLSERIPITLRLSLMAGTTTWGQLSRSDRFYYETGGARGGPLPDRDEGLMEFPGDESAAPSGAYETEKTMGFYCVAIGAMTLEELDASLLEQFGCGIEPAEPDDYPPTAEQFAVMRVAPVSPAGPLAVGQEAQVLV
ncbi:MAG TPA: hypothetical protein VL737_03215 [Candidatus Pristimantibacillus sp.]|jgi:hypothetical protein|nr:hypothetical protein [Candidatus Pristimantibacillus sp.]